MNAPAIRLVQPAKTPRKRASRRVKASTVKLKINRGRVIGGTVLGASIPVFAHTMAQEASFGTNVPSLVVAGCLLYSAPTVYEWASNFAGKPAKIDSDGITLEPARPATLKAFGFVVCLEAVLIASPVEWCAWVAMGLLMAINAVALATRKGIQD